MHEILVAPVRTVAAFFFLLVLARFMGRKMISQMTFFDFTVGITVGTVTANIAMGPNFTSLSSAAVLGMLALLAVAFDITHIKSFLFTKIVDSEPLVLIEQGAINYENLKRARLPVTELLMLLRQKRVFTINDVDYAVLETDGKLSVLLKPERLPVTPSDLSIKSTYRGLGRDLVVDGNIMHENLSYVGWSADNLLRQIKDRGVDNVKDILYAGMDGTGHLYISIKKTGTEPHGKYGID